MQAVAGVGKRWHACGSTHRVLQGTSRRFLGPASRTNRRTMLRHSHSIRVGPPAHQSAANVGAHGEFGVWATERSHGAERSTALSGGRPGGSSMTKLRLNGCRSRSWPLLPGREEGRRKRVRFTRTREEEGGGE
eukprot:2947029-Rhodomonas_salina.1